MELNRLYEKVNDGQDKSLGAGRLTRAALRDRRARSQLELLHRLGDGGPPLLGLEAGGEGCEGLGAEDAIELEVAQLQLLNCVTAV